MANNAKVSMIMEEIKACGCEAEILKWLVDDRLREIRELDNLVCIRDASLRAIKKINNGKNEAIEALCE